MPTDGNTTDPLQFDKAEFATAAGLSCKVCKQPITDSYFTVNGHSVCPSCREKLGDGNRSLKPEAMAKAVALGLGAAVAGAAVWGGIREASHTELGIVAWGAGILIGRAVRYGSGTGGVVYQGIAVALTYLCIAMSWLPTALHQYSDPASQAGEIAMSLMRYPVLYATHSVLGAVIYGFGFWQAFRLTAAAPWIVNGPLKVGGVSQAFANG